MTWRIRIQTSNCDGPLLHQRSKFLRREFSLTGTMLAEAQPLQEAIDTDNESYMVGIFLYLQEVACPPIAI